jgi:lysophospholipase L1-like esterase
MDATSQKLPILLSGLFVVGSALAGAGDPKEAFVQERAKSPVVCFGDSITANSCGRNPGWLSYDGVHPGTEGNAVIAQLVNQEVPPMV